MRLTVASMSMVNCMYESMLVRLVAPAWRNTRRPRYWGHFSNRRSTARRAMGDALGIVLSVDAEAQDAPAVQSQFPGKALHFGFYFLGTSLGVQSVEIDADGETGAPG